MSSFVPSVKRGRRKSNETTGTESRVFGPCYEFGSRGTATLAVQGKRWTWIWSMSQPASAAFWRVSGSWTSSPIVIDKPSSLKARHASNLDGPSVFESGALASQRRTRSSDFPASTVVPTESAVVLRLPWRRNLPRVLVHSYGPLYTCLGVTPLWPRQQLDARRRKGSERGSTSKIAVFPSPILQIASSPFASTNRLDGGATCLLVRLEDSTHMMNVTANPEFALASSDPSHTISGVSVLDQSATEGRRHVDVVLDPSSWARAVIVDEGGGVWLWWEKKLLERGRHIKTTQLVKLREATSDSKDGFFRVAFGLQPNTVLVMSRHSVEELSADPLAIAPRQSRTLLSLSDSSEVLTAMETAAILRGSVFTCVCTTKHVLWIDQSGTQSPTLQWRHELGGELDQDLRLDVLPTPNASLVPGDLVFVYQPSSGRVHGALASNHGPAALLSEPWVLTRPPMSQVSTLNSFFPPSYEGSPGTVKLVATGDGSFSVAKLSLAKAGDSARSSLPSLSSTLACTPASATPFHSAAGMETKDQVLHGRWAWLAINDDATVPRFDLEEYHQQLREDEGILDIVTTSGELARDITYAGPAETRASALRIVNYDANTSTKDIGGVPLSRYFAFSATNGTLLSGSSDPVPAVKDGPVTRQKSSAQVKEEQQAPLRLRNDLFMSTQVVYSADPGPLRTPGAQDPTVDELFAEAAGQLSLEEQIPTLSLAFLPPLPKLASPEAHGDQSSGAPSPPDVSAASSLLREWRVGTNPRQYEWQTSRLSAPPESPPRRERAGLPPRHSMAMRLPPRPLSPLPRHPPHSSPARPLTPSASAQSLRNSLLPASPTQLGSSSQSFSQPDPFPQTQIERGAYGARPEVATKASKKKAKRRQGGF